MKFYRKVLRDLVLQHRGNKKELLGAEIGVAIGKTSRFLLDNIPELKLLCVDSWQKPPDNSPYAATRDTFANNSQEIHALRFRATLERLESYILQRRALIMNMPSQAAAENIKAGHLDFVFIDADHSYEGVKADILAWWPKVKPGGLFCGHDYVLPEPGQELDARGRGVVKAVKEFFFTMGAGYQTAEGGIWWVAKP